MPGTTRQRGFTLVELVMVIVIMGIVGTMVSVFMKSPIDAYFATLRRAALSDVTDTAVRRMARDVRGALPNSLRPLSIGTCIEFIPVKFGGRYRAEPDSTGAGNTLDFSAADDSFDMLGSNSVLPNQAIVAGDLIAVYNLGISGADVYNSDNVSAVISPGVEAGSLANESKINIDSKLFPLASGGNRFHVIPAAEQAVSYVCTTVGTTNGDGSGILYRYVRPRNATFSCPTTLSGVAGATELARNVSTCTFDYSGTDLHRNATARINLGIKKGDETVRLYQEVHVDNTP